MKQNTQLCCAAALLCALFLCFAGCGEAQSETPNLPPSQQPVSTTRKTKTELLLAQSPEQTVYQNESAAIDASCTDKGYILVRYTGKKKKAKLQVTIPEGTVYTYTLRTGEYEVFPLTGGSGSYTVDVYGNAYDDMYALEFSQQLQVALADEFSPFLYPNQYVWYTGENQVFDKSIELSRQSADDLDYVEHVYNYMIENVEYDEKLAENVPVGYLPDITRTLNSKTGICFDYASLMTALLRMQGIPTRLVVGYSGEQYHAWIDVYLEQVGWVNNIIYFDGIHWSLMDPTLGAGSSEKRVKKYIGDGSNYLAKYHY